MDNRILSVTEQLMRDQFHLSDSYTSNKCTINGKIVSLGMTNSIIDIKADFPRTLIDEMIEAKEGESEEEPSDKEEVKDKEQKKETEITKEIVEDEKKPLKKAKKLVKKLHKEEK
jgi:hypothetical protein